MHIAVDAMGGDFGPTPCVVACLDFLRCQPDLRITLVGAESVLRDLVGSYSNKDESLDRLHVLHADDVVSMEERPIHALKEKSQSSMALAMKMLAIGDVDACISAGNTGALMAFGISYLKCLPGVHRPAISKALPSAGGSCLVLDLGANLKCTADNLYQYAVMGLAQARVHGRSRPRVGLINVGKEQHKGHEVQQQANKKIKDIADIEYLGFIEGRDVYTGEIDVAVCDGFTGNVLLKASEGAADLMYRSLVDMLQTGWKARIARFFAKSMLNDWRQNYDPESYNGASLLGLNGIVVKCHGNAQARGFTSALRVALEQSKCKIVSSIATLMEGGPHAPSR